MKPAAISFGGFIPGTLVKEIASLYSFASRSKTVVARRADLPSIHVETFSQVALLMEAAGWPNPSDPIRFRINKAPWGYSTLKLNKNAMVGFSGGKDSVAAAIKLKHRGYSVSLVYVKGINRVLNHDEYVSRSAAVLDMPLQTIHVKVTGNNDTWSNPFRNQVILSMLAETAHAAGAGCIAIGNTYTEKKSPYLVNWSDGLDVLNSMKAIIEKAMPGMLVHTTLLRSETESLLTVFRENPVLLEASISCQCSNRDHLRARVEKQYGVTLEKNTCGTCWKCLHRYIVLHSVGHLKLPASFLHYCKAKLTSIARSKFHSRSDAVALDQLLDCALLRMP